MVEGGERLRSLVCWAQFLRPQRTFSSQEVSTSGFSLAVGWICGPGDLPTLLPSPYWTSVGLDGWLSEWPLIWPDTSVWWVFAGSVRSLGVSTFPSQWMWDVSTGPTLQMGKWVQRWQVAELLNPAHVLTTTQLRHHHWGTASFQCAGLKIKQEGIGGGREVQEGGDICIPMADWCWCMAEANTIL